MILGSIYWKGGNRNDQNEKKARNAVTSPALQRPGPVDGEVLLDVLRCQLTY